MSRNEILRNQRWSLGRGQWESVSKDFWKIGDPIIEPLMKELST